MRISNGLERLDATDLENINSIVPRECESVTFMRLPVSISGGTGGQETGDGAGGVLIFQ
jgi:hypothetical protein